MVEKKSTDLDKYEKPAVTVDTIIFRVVGSDLKVLLVKRNITPFKDKWSIPGGFVAINKSLEDAAKFKLEEKTGVTDVYLEQLYTFGNPGRDPRGRVITVTYFALLNSEHSSNVDTLKVQDAQWFSMQKLPSLAFDHKEILTYALKRLKWKFEYTTVAFSMLPKKFTMTQVQELYEIVFDTNFDKRNFRKKILAINILEEQEVMRNVSFRPPKLYSLKTDVGEIVNILAVKSGSQE
ncbi:MAG: NUDIX hydrolase [Candidatus Woesearchaeota archaeon]